MGNCANGNIQKHKAEPNGVVVRYYHHDGKKKEEVMGRKEFDLLAFGYTSDISSKTSSIRNNKVESKDSSSMRTLHLPCRTMIREICCGGNFTIFRTFSNNLFIKHIGESKRGHAIRLSGKVAKFKYQKINLKGGNHNDLLWGDKLKRLNYSKKMKNAELEEVFCSNHSICLRMKDNSIAIFDDYSKSLIHFNDYKGGKDLKFVFSGPLASTFMFVNNRNQVNLCQHKEFDLSIKNYEPFIIRRNIQIPIDREKCEIIKGVCGAEKSFLVIEDLIDRTHQIYSYNEKGQTFAILSTPFQGERIQDISCGYRHMALILECGDVFISNSTNDISFKLIYFPLFPFIKLNEPPKRRSNPNRKQELSKDPCALIYERDQYEGTIKAFTPQKVQCSSLATFFLNEKGCIILGQPCNDVTPTFLFDDGSSAFYHAFNEDGKVPNSEISVGGWHFSFHQTKFISQTSLKYFQSMLKNLTTDGERKLTDMSIICQE